jgi:hypothetical protein
MIHSVHRWRSGHVPRSTRPFPPLLKAKPLWQRCVMTAEDDPLRIPLTDGANRTLPSLAPYRDIGAAIGVPSGDRKVWEL